MRCDTQDQVARRISSRMCATEYVWNDEQAKNLETMSTYIKFKRREPRLGTTRAMRA